MDVSNQELNSIRDFMVNISKDIGAIASDVKNVTASLAEVKETVASFNLLVKNQEQSQKDLCSMQETVRDYELRIHDLERNYAQAKNDVDAIGDSLREAYKKIGVLENAEALKAKAIVYAVLKYVGLFALGGACAVIAGLLFK